MVMYILRQVEVEEVPAVRELFKSEETWNRYERVFMKLRCMSAPFEKYKKVS